MVHNNIENSNAIETWVRWVVIESLDPMGPQQQRPLYRYPVHALHACRAALQYMDPAKNAKSRKSFPGIN